MLHEHAARSRSIPLWRPYSGGAGVDLHRKQSLRKERVGDTLLFGQARRGHDADLVGAMAVGFFHRGGIDAPEASELRRGFLWMRLDPFAGLIELGEDRVQHVAAPVGECR